MEGQCIITNKYGTTKKNFKVFFPEHSEGKNIFIVSYYRQLSADIKMKIIRLKPVLLAPKGAKAWANKTGIIIFFNIRRKLFVIRCYA